MNFIPKSIFICKLMTIGKIYIVIKSVSRFNMNVDAAFTAHVQLALQCFPLDPATAEATKAEFIRRAGATSWDDFALVGEMGEQREKVKDSLHNTLGELAKLFKRDTSGPFLLGTRASYADLMLLDGYI